MLCFHLSYFLFICLFVIGRLCKRRWATPTFLKLIIDPLALHQSTNHQNASRTNFRLCRNWTDQRWTGLRQIASGTHHQDEGRNWPRMFPRCESKTISILCLNVPIVHWSILARNPRRHLTRREVTLDIYPCWPFAFFDTSTNVNDNFFIRALMMCESLLITTA